MSFQPEIYPSIGDITKIGVPKSRSNLTIAEEVFASIPIGIDDVKSIYVKVVMASETSSAFAQFEMTSIFKKYGPTPPIMKYQIDTVTNRDNPNNKFYFQINGDNIEIICGSGLNEVTHWSGLVAVIGIKG